MCGRTLFFKIPVPPCHSATCHVGRTGRTCPVCQTGLFAAGQDRTGQDRTGQDRTGQDRTGQDRTGQDRTGQDILTAKQQIHSS